MFANMRDRRSERSIQKLMPQKLGRLENLDDSQKLKVNINFVHGLWRNLIVLQILDFLKILVVAPLRIFWNSKILYL
jgi:hypothetical protein